MIYIKIIGNSYIGIAYLKNYGRLIVTRYIIVMNFIGRGHEYV